MLSVVAPGVAITGLRFANHTVIEVAALLVVVGDFELTNCIIEDCWLVFHFYYSYFIYFLTFYLQGIMVGTCKSFNSTPGVISNIKITNNQVSVHINKLS